MNRKTSNALVAGADAAGTQQTITRRAALRLLATGSIAALAGTVALAGTGCGPRAAAPLFVVEHGTPHGNNVSLVEYGITQAAIKLRWQVAGKEPGRILLQKPLHKRGAWTAEVIYAGALIRARQTDTTGIRATELRNILAQASVFMKRGLAAHPVQPGAPMPPPIDSWGTGAVAVQPQYRAPAPPPAPTPPPPNNSAYQAPAPAPAPAQHHAPRPAPAPAPTVPAANSAAGLD
jgi:hypothetical protein